MVWRSKTDSEEDGAAENEGQDSLPDRPTINDIAALSGVSKKTVSRVLNKSPYVSAETRQKVEAIFEQTGYSPDPQARGLAFRRSFLVGVVFDNPNPQYVVTVQLGILDGLMGSGYELVIHPCNRASRNYLSDVRNFVERQKLFGIVLTPSVSEDEQLARILEQTKCPYVRIASVPLDHADRMIVSQDRHGGEQAAQHLIQLGHRKIGFISGPTTFRSSHERRAGLEVGLEAAGLQLRPEYVVEGAYTFASGVTCGTELLSRADRPTAVFCGNDEMAAGLLQAARRANIRVPEDLSVVGYDDFQIAMQTWPTLTTLRSPTRDVARLAALRLFALAAGKPELGPHTESPKLQLIVRESSGPVPS
jgi:LacI family transcriptional regulator